MSDIPLLASPSSQKAFDRCRLKGQLEYIEHWEPREASNSLNGRLRGTAFARAAELIHKAIAIDPSVTLDPAILAEFTDVAVALYERQHAYCINKGITFTDTIGPNTVKELRRVIPMYAQHTPVRQWQAITHIEEPVPQYSCRPDLAGRDAIGVPTVADVKYKASLDAYYETQTIEEYHFDPQFMQYNFWLSSLQPPATPTYSALIMVVGSPFRIKYVEWLYTPEQIHMWYLSALDLSVVINDIRHHGALPRAATSHRDNFGWCPMKKACFEYYLDPELMRQSYVQLDELPQ
jgi:hypothetical protein